MIQANELRVGNWVSNGEKYFTVDASSMCDILYGVIDYIIEPIQLTHEILEKCGFNFNESIRHWAITWGTNGVHFIKKDEHYTGFSFQLGSHHYKVIDNLHELQNLYFALTGEELTINL